MIRSFRIHDPVLVVLALVASLLGLLFIFDAGYARSLGSDHTAIPKEFRSQLMFLLPALALAVFCSRLSPNTWVKLAKWCWFACLGALLLVSKFGTEMNGARRWLGWRQISIQPAEFAKLAVVLYLAAVFAERLPWKKLKPRKDWAQWMDTVLVPKIGRIFPALTILLAVCLIEQEPDLGTAAVIAVTAFVLFIPGGVSKRSLVAAVCIAALGCWGMVKKEPYRLERITNHIQRWAPTNVDDTSYQTVQSELAMATGGVTGVGIGNGRAKQVIPATTTDFVMATVAEEFGLIGSLAVLAVMGGFVWRLFYQASRAPSRFGSLVLFGFGSWIGIQACVNVMMANGFLPAIGIPFPFLSSGGSSLIALWCAVGVCESVISAPILTVAQAKERKQARRAATRRPVAVG